MPHLAFLTSQSISSAALRRLQQAAENSPPFKLGESHSDGVQALQRGLIALCDPEIAIPSGPTGNYLRETQAAVRAFQAKFGLFVDGAAGRETIHALDRELGHRSQRVLERLDRCIDGCKPCWVRDSTRLDILRQMEADIRTLKSTNVLGFAAAAVPLVLLVILFFALLMFCAAPQNQKAMQRLMSEVIDAIRGRGEVLQQKIEDLKARIRSFLNDLTEIRSECEKNKEQSAPDEFRRCKQAHALLVKAAFDALIRTMRTAGETIIIGLQGESLGPRGLRRFHGLDAYVELGRAFVNYLDALNDFLRCLNCPEIPFPFFPDFPNFP